MDEELKQLAALALRNAFWKDFSGLVNKYLEASEGLDIDQQERLMGEETSVYGRDRKEPFDGFLNIYSTGPTYRDCSHDSVVEALEWSKAHAVFLQGLKVFERRDGEWVFTGDEHDPDQ
jgi:hypothetical protein